jgi:septal ring factor EnvC (AmiA/AmiB activator)
MSRIVAPGRVEPISEALEVAAEVSGRIASLLVEEGDRVEAGAVIARLVSADHEARVASARAALAVARRVAVWRAAAEWSTATGPEPEAPRGTDVGLMLAARPVGDEIDRLSVFDPLTGSTRQTLDAFTFYPAKQFVTAA